MAQLIAKEKRKPRKKAETDRPEKEVGENKKRKQTQVAKEKKEEKKMRHQVITCPISTGYLGNHVEERRFQAVLDGKKKAHTNEKRKEQRWRKRKRQIKKVSIQSIIFGRKSIT